MECLAAYLQKDWRVQSSVHCLGGHSGWSSKGDMDYNVPAFSIKKHFEAKRKRKQDGAELGQAQL